MGLGWAVQCIMGTYENKQENAGYDHPYVSLVSKKMGPWMLAYHRHFKITRGVVAHCDDECNQASPKLRLLFYVATPEPHARPRRTGRAFYYNHSIESFLGQSNQASPKLRYS